MNKKQILTIAGIIVILLIIGGLTWYFLSRSRTPAPTATSTSPTASTSPTIDETAHIKESAKYYTIDLQYPASTPLATGVSPAANDAAVAVMKAYAQTSRDEFISNNDFTADWVKDYAANGGNLAISSTYEQHSGSQTLSYVFDTYADTGGAHPNSYYRTFMFDTKSGKQLALSDLFIANSQYLQKLSMISRAQLTGNIYSGDETGPDQMLLDGTTPTTVNFQSFYIDGKNLVILFDPYQVAAYAGGPQKVSIPLSQLGDILKTEYK